MTTRDLLRRFSLRPPHVKFAEQFQYGGIEAIRLNLDLPSNCLLKGSLQHGFYPEVTRDMYLGMRSFISPSREAPLFAWNEFTSESWDRHGGRSIIIGSPWAHLVEYLQRNNSLHLSASKDYLYVPSHGYLGQTLEIEHTDLNNLEEDLRDYLKPDPTEKLSNSVCLYWTEFLNHDTRKDYAIRFGEVLCAGYRGSGAFEMPWDNSGGRKSFLRNIFDFIYNHKIIVLDEASSFFWYAAHLGKPIYLTRDVNLFLVSKSGDKHRKVELSNLDYARKIGIAPIPVGKILNKDGEYTEIASRILGINHVQNSAMMIKKYLTKF